MNDIDEIMSLDPVELSKRPGGIDAVIAYQRKARAQYEAGVKPKKEAGPKIKVDLADLGFKVAPQEAVKRRV